MSELLEIQLMTDTTILQVRLAQHLSWKLSVWRFYLTFKPFLPPCLLGVHAGHHAVFCGKCPWAAALCHHTRDCGKCACGVLHLCPACLTSSLCHWILWYWRICLCCLVSPLLRSFLATRSTGSSSSKKFSPHSLVFPPANAPSGILGKANTEGILFNCSSPPVC